MPTWISEFVALKQHSALKGIILKQKKTAESESKRWMAIFWCQLELRLGCPDPETALSCRKSEKNNDSILFKSPKNLILGPFWAYLP